MFVIIMATVISLYRRTRPAFQRGAGHYGIIRGLRKSGINTYRTNSHIEECERRQSSLDVARGKYQPQNFQSKSQFRWSYFAPIDIRLIVRGWPVNLRSLWKMFGRGSRTQTEHRRPGNRELLHALSTRGHTTWLAHAHCVTYTCQ